MAGGGGVQERRWLSAPRVFVDGDGGDGSNSDGGGDLFSSIALRCLPPPPLPIHAADPPASSSAAKVIRAFLLQIASQLWLLLPPRYCCIALILLSPSQFRLHSLNMLNCQGSTAIGIKTKEGVVLAIEKRITSPLLVLARGVDCDLALLSGESEEFWERLLPLFQPLCWQLLRSLLQFDTKSNQPTMSIPR